MGSRYCDAADPVGHTAALGTDIGQDGPDGHGTQNHGDGQDDHKLWNFRSFLIEQHKTFSFPQMGSNKNGWIRPRKGVRTRRRSTRPKGSSGCDPPAGKTTRLRSDRAGTAWPAG